MNLTIKIFKSVDAFLYLPVYVAKELQIFDDIFKKHHLDNIQVIWGDSDEIKSDDDKSKLGTDIYAIEQMLYSNHSLEKDSIAICIADPMAFLTKLIDSEYYDVESCVIIGSLISRLPFWAVNHKVKSYSDLKALSHDYKNIIHYEKNLTTGFALGRKIVELNKKNCTSIETSFGAEIGLCENKNKNRSKDEKCVAITADVVGLVQNIYRPTNPLQINYKFSKEEYLSTGILTTKSVSNNPLYKQILTDIIEGIQKAILIVYSSEKIALQVANEVATKINSKNKEDKPKITNADVRNILKLIRVENLYPADLNISKDIWTKTLNDLSESINLRENVIIEESFDRYVDNSFIISSEKSIADQLGIDLDTFRNEIDNDIIKLSKINPALFKISKALTKLKWKQTFLFLGITFVLSIIAFASLRYVLGTKPDEIFKNLMPNIIAGFIGSLLGVSIKLWRNTKKNDVTLK